MNFGASPYLGVTLAFSRFLMDHEILVVANSDTANSITVTVIVDLTLFVARIEMRVLCSNAAAAAPVGPSAVGQIAGGNVVVAEVDGSTGTGPVNCVTVTLGAMEVQILGK